MTELKELKFLDRLAMTLYGRTLKDAHMAGICIDCGESVEDAELTWSASDDREYVLSGLCPTCYQKTTEEDE